MKNVRVTLSDHARKQMVRRGLDERLVRQVASSPDQIISVRPGREIRQSLLTLPPEGRTYVIRVFVDTADEGNIVVTAYRSSKIGKYWRLP